MNTWTGKPSLTKAEELENDGFWVDLAMNDLMSWMRIPSEYADDTIKQELIGAMIEINRQLTPIKAVIVSDYETLEDYCTAHSETIGGVETLVQKYKEAVFSYAKAVLLQQFKTMNRKEIAENMAKEGQDTEHYWLNRSLNAVLFFFKKFDVDSNAIDSPVKPTVALL